MRHIIAQHHSYLRTRLPAIEILVAGLEENQSDTTTLKRLVRQFRSEMDQHMKKEEAILFPMIEKLENAASSGIEIPRFPFGSIANPIAVMEEEHERSRGELAEIRSITNGYTSAPGRCADERSVLEGLKELDVDMDIHSRLEDEILFPRAIGLERT
ncbi:MAG TPA: hemerythrin domain-containing protein [Bryobacteraceae bacterium]|nr:hemerythrin domain-containing protein [Bryobacteraceae bacterium]